MVKKFRPTTPGQRKLVLPSFGQLTRVSGKRATIKPTKSLLVSKKRTNGRNHHGHITCRHKGGGHKRFYRLIDFKRDKDGIEAKVASVEYDPNRSAHIALLNYRDGEKRYIIAPEGIKAGDVLLYSKPSGDTAIGGLDDFQIYYVKSAPTANTITLCATTNGNFSQNSTIGFSSAGTSNYGRHTLVLGYEITSASKSSRSYTIQFDTRYRDYQTGSGRDRYTYTLIYL